MKNSRFRFPKRPLILERLDDRLAPAIIQVTSLADSGAGTLRAAINQANNEGTNPGADTIVFAGAAVGGTVSLTTNGGTDYGPSAFEITSDITIQGSVTTAETLSIPATTLMRFFYVAPSSALKLDRLQLTGGTAQGGAGGFGGGGGGAGMGGAIYNQGTLVINNSTLFNNSAIGGNGGDSSNIVSGINGNSGGGGGGMFGNGGAAGTSLAGSGGGGFFGNGGSGLNSNSTGGGGGGTVADGGTGPAGGTGGIQNGGIGGNFSTGTNGGDGQYGGGGGGGVASSNGGNGGIGGGGGGGGFNGDALNSSGGSGGFGGGGGGGYIQGGNGGLGGGGGGGYINVAAGGNFGGTGSSAFDFSSGAFIGAGGGGAGLGGAIFNDNAIVTITNSTFSGNQAKGGTGGAGNLVSNNGGPGDGAGGSIFTYGSTNSVVTILNSTLVAGSAVSGLEIYSQISPNTEIPPTLNIDNTIVGKEVTTNFYLSGFALGGGTNNLIPASQIFGPIFNNTVTALPNLGPLQDNGGGINTYLPLSGSPAIDAGNNSVATSLTSDERLYLPRIVGSTIDIGAVEVGAQPAVPILTAPANQKVLVSTNQAFDIGSLSDLNNSGNYTVTVNWGDGTGNTVFTQPTVGTLTQQSHTYATVGTYTVSVVASDVDGTSNTITFTVNVVSVPVLTAPPDQTVLVSTNSPINLGSISDLNNSGNYSVTVNWGDGSALTNFNQLTVGALTQQSHTFAAVGPYTVSVVATDVDGTSNTITFTVNVVSTPVLTAPTNQTVLVSTNGSFNLGSISDLNNSGNYSIIVNWGDGTANTVFNQPAVGTLTQQSHTYAAVGPYTVSVVASDVDGTSNTIQFTVNVVSVPVLTAPADQTVLVSTNGSFNLGTLSDLNNSGNYSVTVNWGDGSADTVFSQSAVGTLTAQSHTYALVGPYTVSVVATDVDGTSNTITFTVNVVSVPVLTAPADQTGVKGVNGTFDLGTLSDLNNSGNYTVTVNWGDGTANTVFTQPTVGTLTQQSHTYSPQNTYTVTVFASDVDGTSNTISFNIVVANSPPVLTAPADQTSFEGSTTTFNLGSLSDLNNSGTYSVAVNWGDGSANTVFTQAAVGALTAQSHNYIQNGTYVVTISALDADGESNNSTFNVVTANVLPTITPAATQTGLTNKPITLNIGSFTDPGIADTPWKVVIDFGDGSSPVNFNQPSTGAIPQQTHTFTKAGTFTVTISVTDDVGTSSATFKVVVSDFLGTTFAVGGPRTGESLTANAIFRYDASPFGSLYSDTVRVAEGDVTGDGVPDLIAGTGPGSVNCFFVIDGVTHKSVHGKVPFEQSFTGGIFVAVGDLNGDGRDEIIATADIGGSTRVRVFDGNTIAPIADFFGIDDSNFRGGAHAAVGDFNNDGIGDLIITAGVGGGPRVAIYDGNSIMQNNPVKLVPDFFAFDPNFRGGVYVAAGDVNGDGFADAIFGAGFGGSPRVEVVSGKTLLSTGGQQVFLANFFAGDPNDRNGVRVAAKNLDGDNLADIVTGSGDGSGTRVRAYLGITLTPNGTPPTFLDFDAFSGVSNGVFVG